MSKEIKAEVLSGETIDLEVIKEKIASLRKDDEQLRANLNATAGAINVLEQLLRE